LVQPEGTIQDSNSDYGFPSIAANQFGDVVIGFTRSGPTEYASAYAMVGSTDSGTHVTTFGSPTLLKAGVDVYDIGDNRWGDYSATTVDAADPFIFWTIQEYAEAVDDFGLPNWGTQVAQIIIPHANEARWKDANGGTFGDGARWLSGASPASADHAIFSVSTGSSSYTATLSGNVTNNRLSVRQGNVNLSLAGNTYTLANTSAATPGVTIGEFGGTPQLTVTGGTLSSVNATLSAGAAAMSTMTLGSAATWNNSGSIYVGGSSTSPGGQATLNIQNGASLNVGGTLKVWDAGIVNFTSGHVSAGSLALLGSAQFNMSTGHDKALVINALSVAAGAKLDLADNTLILNYGSDTTHSARDAIRNLLVNGRNAGPASAAPWNGLGGIMSSYANANGNGFNLAIGYGDNEDLAAVRAAGSYTSFGGQTVASNTILVQLTRGADATMDGVVDGQDVAIIGTHFQKPGSGQWCFGDFDYSGTCDGSDVSVLGTTFGKTSPILSPAQMTAEFGSAFTSAFEAGQSGAVPEPGSLVVLGFGAIALLAPRRRKRGVNSHA